MPLYEVAHSAPLSQTQKDALAEALTTIHSTKFTVPRMFINVVFTDSSATPTYVGGKLRQSNRIVARVRRGSSRTQEVFDSLCRDIRAAWSRIVHPDVTDGQLPPQILDLKAVFITGELIAGMKADFPVPSAGNELAWAQENYQAFKKRADAGDEDFVDLVAELKTWSGFDPSKL